ncbi:MAG: hypothetical protein JXL84_24170 [Deltaproteobacteria bacterium]|nr:hypothetical protein [Deltaproteobacteria bacterium]
MEQVQEARDPERVEASGEAAAAVVAAAGSGKAVVLLRGRAGNVFARIAGRGWHMK